MNAEQQQQEDRYELSDSGRLVNFSDGVFAFAITFLVINIKLNPPFTTYHDYLADISNLAVSSLYYLLTFAVIANYWLSNRHILRVVRRQDTVFTWLTFLNLAFVVFFPVSLNILLNSHDVDGHSYILGVILYTLALAGFGFSSFLLWTYATWHHRLIVPSVPLAEIRLYGILRLVKPMYYCLTLLLLFIPAIARHPDDLFFSWIALPLLLFLVRRLMHDGMPHANRQQTRAPAAEKAAN